MQTVVLASRVGADDEAVEDEGMSGSQARVGQRKSNAMQRASIESTPTVKTIGSMCTNFSDSGYFLYRLMRAMPEL